ncbi:YihY/virulence factor BrkB family protein [Atopobacter phocae]|uniref:YihY/virulence factor BrkB family protein n=1 Tax=Atopobacter phocae TaxID=136492 RepID=UPI00046EC796|nr:YihY/virulence factor BrkB family protein [Atopobacter phocae]
MKNKNYRTRLAEFMTVFKRNWQYVNLSQQASTMAFFALLALFPFLLALANLIPLLPVDKGELFAVMKTTVPSDVYNVVQPILSSYLKQSTGGALSLSLLISFWPATKGLSAMQEMLNQVYDAQPRANFILTRIMSFVIGLALAVLTTIVSFIFVFGNQIIEFLEQQFNFNVISLASFDLYKWIIAFMFMFLVGVLIYTIVPNVNWSLKYSVPGAIVLTLGFLLISQLFSLYVSFASQSFGPGTFGVVIVMIMWMYIINMVIIIGGFINVLWYRFNHPRVEENQQVNGLQSGELAFSSDNMQSINPETIILSHRIIKRKG